MNKSGPLPFTALEGATFGAFAQAGPGHCVTGLLSRLQSAPEEILEPFYASGGLLVLRGLAGLEQQPQALVHLSQLFGREVENYRDTPAARNQIHPTQPEIFIVANRPPVSRPPPKRPEPPFTEDGALPTRFPHRRGWHTDQSYRRPPPDISLFLAVKPVPQGQAETLYASGTLAYRALPEPLKQRVDGLVGLHCASGKGRTEQAALAGEAPLPLTAEERPQRQPVVRVHPVTGEPALFLCEAGQMDWVDGPFEGMEPGPHGEGARLLYELMAHYTRDEFVYVHRWEPGDLTIYDNRNLIHAATWFDAERFDRVMWRTTVWGNPGPAYAGERKSWL